MWAMPNMFAKKTGKSSCSNWTRKTFKPSNLQHRGNFLPTRSTLFSSTKFIHSVQPLVLHEFPSLAGPTWLFHMSDMMVTGPVVKCERWMPGWRPDQRGTPQKSSKWRWHSAPIHGAKGRHQLRAECNNTSAIGKPANGISQSPTVTNKQRSDVRVRVRVWSEQSALRL